MIRNILLILSVIAVVFYFQTNNQLIWFTIFSCSLYLTLFTFINENKYEYYKLKFYYRIYKKISKEQQKNGLIRNYENNCNIPDRPINNWVLTKALNKLYNGEDPIKVEMWVIKTEKLMKK